MHRMGSGHVLAASVPQRHPVQAAEQVFSAAQQHGADGDVHLVDEPGLQVLPDGGHATTQAHVQVGRSW